MADLLDSIVRADRAYLIRVIEHFGVPPSAVDDVLQEVFWAVARSSCHYDPSRGKLRTWLHRVTFYHAQNFLGRAHHRREVLRAAPCDAWRDTVEPMQNDADPEQAAIDNDNRQLAWELIQKIEVHRRAVFLAYEIKGMPMAALAETLGIPISTGWSRLQQARREFADALRQHRVREALASMRRRQ